jgi:hypothetical protein
MRDLFNKFSESLRILKICGKHIFQLTYAKMSNVFAVVLNYDYDIPLNKSVLDKLYTNTHNEVST